MSNWVQQWRSLKTWQQFGLIGGLVFFWLVGTIIQTVEERTAQQEVQQEQAYRQQQDAAVQALFERVAVSSGYRPQIIQWGNLPTLTMERQSYLFLNTEEQSLIEDWMYSQYKSAHQIVIGRKKDANTIYMDQQVHP